MKDRPNLRGVLERLIQRVIGETQVAAVPAKAPLRGWTTMRFRAPSVQQFMRREGAALVLAIVVVGLIVFVLVVVLGALSFQVAGVEPDTWMTAAVLIGTVTFVLMLVVGLAAVRLAIGYLLAERGELRLGGDSLTEIGLFNRVRVFKYEQIYEVRGAGEAERKSFIRRRMRGPHIRYYEYGEDGRIAADRIRQARLIDVRGRQRVAREIERRMAGPPPNPDVELQFLRRTVGLPLLIQVAGGICGLAGGILAVVPLIRPGWRGVVVLALLGLWIVAWLGVGVYRRLEENFSGGEPPPTLD